ncbi:cation:proton antiporter [Marinobacter psychrophilus]|uniref:cation:proton antiporter n=1 Tax=Marinobacter psychrophilus TaxID=330734 RepID=UPI001B52A6CA|nr:monovalent cation/H(+) antiporter subunit G [Marinobacter psychrophilus]MBQ0763154.1 monovalent cation/H(+) antiporter subunit G [Marinobacter psychrophilus]MBQ0843955.1 monovalent cation/H(+) antiporter subunit G [Marinobacter psychrophilus]
MSLLDVFTVIMTASGLFFFFAGSIGIVRFPDVFCRLHALTKVDNLSLGLIMFGVLPQAASIFDALQIIIIWLLVMVSGAVSCYLVANQAEEDLSTDTGIQPNTLDNVPMRRSIKPINNSSIGSANNGI